MAGLKRGHDGKIAGLYDLDKTLGRGHFAVVKLARHVFTGEKVHDTHTHTHTHTHTPFTVKSRIEP